ncbi:MAG: RtcB family protein [Arhodomonas sp.]|nr:RtcB family protein [Arhodomonas sp.]
MDLTRFTRVDATTWRLEPQGAMRVPGVLYADETLIQAMDPKVAEQLANVASLPGIVGDAYAMPDAHWGYGFPIGGVAAFDPEAGGVVSARRGGLRHLLRRAHPPHRPPRR